MPVDCASALSTSACLTNKQRTAIKQCRQLNTSICNLLLHLQAERKKHWEEAHRAALATATSELAAFDKDSQNGTCLKDLFPLSICNANEGNPTLCRCPYVALLISSSSQHASCPQQPTQPLPPRKRRSAHAASSTAD